MQHENQQELNFEIYFFGETVTLAYQISLKLLCALHLLNVLSVMLFMLT